MNSKELDLIENMNEIIYHSDNVKIRNYYPVSHNQIIQNNQMCLDILDYIGTIYVKSGFDENYDETAYGHKLSTLMKYLIENIG